MMASTVNLSDPSDTLLRRRVGYLLSSLSKLSLDNVFYNAQTGERIPFASIFPPGKYAVVGNSPQLLERQNGKEIDSADYVIRFSDYQTKNYEPYTGSKTSLWITGSARKLPDEAIPLIYISTSYEEFQKKQENIMARYGKPAISSFILFHDDNLLRTVITTLQCVPSVGLLTLLLLSVRYKNILTYGYSFGYHRGQYHYCVKDARPGATQDLNKESRVYDYLLTSHAISGERLLNGTTKSKRRGQSRRASNTSGRIPVHIRKLYKARHDVGKSPFPVGVPTVVYRQRERAPPSQIIPQSTKTSQGSVIMNGRSAQIAQARLQREKIRETSPRQNQNTQHVQQKIHPGQRLKPAEKESVTADTNKKLEALVQFLNH